MRNDTAGRPPLDRDRLADPAGGPGAGWRVEVLAESPSTNQEAAARARAGAAEGLVVVAEHQTSGRGRLDRGWQTPPRAALTLSVVLRPPGHVPAVRWPWLPLAAGVAVAGTLREQGYAAGLKWPNDVLLETVGASEAAPERRKVCGILVERVETPERPAAVVGIGLNTSQAVEELPVPTATSLELAGGRPVDRTGVLLALLARLGEAYATWRERPGDLATRYRAMSATIGEPVRAELPGGGVLEGTAVAVDEHGRLVIRHAGGETAVGAGDVVHARLAR